MAKLYPTKTRLALLRDVQDQAVHQHTDGTSTTNGGWSRVTARMTELERAGWAAVGDTINGHGLRRWELTTAGRAILDRYRTPSER